VRNIAEDDRIDAVWIDAFAVRVDAANDGSLLRPG
jgi:hypothetical protein